MVKTPSGKIRTALGRLRGEAVKHAEKYKHILEQAPTPWDEETRIAMQAVGSSMEADLSKFDELWKKWEDINDGIADETERDEDEALYNQWRDDPQYADLLFKLDEYVQLIKSKLSFLLRSSRGSSVASTQRDDDNLTADLRLTATKNVDAANDLEDDIDARGGDTARDDERPATPESMFTLNPRRPAADKQKKPTPIQLITTPIPPLNIPKFKGDMLEWDGFWQRFDYAVHAKPYPKIEKLYALMNLLEGRAKEEIDGFQLNEKNYDTVVATLKERFDNKQDTIAELQTHLRSMARATSDPTVLRHTVNAINNICRQLQNHGSNIDNEPMKMDIMDKMPDALREELYWLNRSSHVSTDVLLKKMKQMALKAETKPPPIEPPQLKTTMMHGRSTQMSQPQRTPTTTRQRPPISANQSQPTCILCNGQHCTHKCSTYTTPESKVKQLRIQRRCIRCMQDNHISPNCSRKLECYNCKGAHLAFLCLKQHKVNNNTSAKAMVAINKCQNAMLAKKIIVSHPHQDRTTETTVLFDSGSQRSYVTRKLIKQLDLPIVQKETLNVTGFGGKQSKIRSDLVLFKLKVDDGWTDVYASSTNKIVENVPMIERKDAETFVNNGSTPDILIGMDYYCDYVRGSTKINEKMYRFDSIFGEIFTGKIPIATERTIVSLAVEEPPDTDDDCQMLWKLESMGITESALPMKDDVIALRKMEESLEYKKKRYSISWPFKDEHSPLPSNYGVALARFRQSVAKMRQQPVLFDKAQTIIDDQLRRGTIEVAPTKHQSKMVHYLPHHFVINEEKATTKIRMVFNASAKASTNPSLNNCMYRGPIDMPEIPGLLFRLRTPEILLTGDVEKAFHAIHLHEPDRDSTRFLWMKDLNKELAGDNLITYRFVGVPFGVVASPSILQMVLQHHIFKTNDMDLRDILKNIFVDNIFLLEETTDDAIEKFQLVRDCFLDASMNVREWMSNDSKVMASIPEELQQGSSVTKVLGLVWNAHEDTFSTELKKVELKEPWTKRKVLKFIASTYDPLGLLSPVTIKARIFMKKLFQEKLQWDDFIGADNLQEWNSIVDGWQGSINIPRKYFRFKFSLEEDIELHAFADASQLAYCAVVYLRMRTKNGYCTMIVFAKTRLQPLKKNLTIPKMEIMGIWLASKLLLYVQKEMNLPNCKKFIWTDSQISYYWFQKWPKDVFVANRLKEVLEAKAECNFVPGKLNPADLGTRGISMDELQKAEQWINGPTFLRDDRNKWPRPPDASNDMIQTIIALVSVAQESTSKSLQAGEMKRRYDIDTSLSWKELKVQVAMVMKDVDVLLAMDIQNAEETLICQEQELLVKAKDMEEYKLSKDERGLLRINSRFDHAELINAHPIYVPKTSPIAKMIVMDIHENLHHAGIPHTLSKLRETYWIPSGRALVKKCINKCSTCKIWRCKSFELPNMPQLPKTRVTKSKPFEKVGVDYGGPFKIKETTEKSWIILFTCFTTRLCHIELVQTMTAEDFLLAFRNFVGRCGKPDYVLSDNAKQFKTTAKALDELWPKVVRDPQSIDYFSQKHIQWDFITERAPWKGGLYERMIGIVKNALKVTTGRKVLKFNQLKTLLIEIEATVNSRPLTYVHATEPFVIRPCDFIFPKANIQLPTITNEDVEKDPTYMPTSAGGGERLVEKYQKNLQLLDKFWRIWSKDYLNLLRERNQLEHKNIRGAIQRRPMVGEIVLVYEPDQPRNNWKAAKINDVIRSSDGKYRSCEIQYMDGFVTRRALNHLFPLEEGAEVLSLSDAEEEESRADTE